MSPSESLQGRPLFKAEMRKLGPADQYKGKRPKGAWRWGLESFLWLEGYSGDQLLNHKHSRNVSTYAQLLQKQYPQLLRVEGRGDCEGLVRGSSVKGECGQRGHCIEISRPERGLDMKGSSRNLLSVH